MNQYDNVNFLARGEDFEKFWAQYLSNDKHIKYIMGLGFDPRTMNCFTSIRKQIQSENMDYKVIEYDMASSSDPQLKQMLDHNTKSLKTVLPENEWNRIKINTDVARENTSLAASKSVQPNELDEYTDIILDITAMPTSVYFPITRNILDWIATHKIRSITDKQINFHLVVSENPRLDGAIRDKKIDESITYMHKFATKLQRDADAQLPKVWIPLLGEGQRKQLNMIRKQVADLEEFCPLFPMPSSDPYRSQKLLMEHRDLLTDDLGISSKDYIYAHESNPFEVCRKIYNTSHLYYDLFQPLGGCKIVLSPVSNKLMCVGALLAACELLAEKSNAGVVHVAARGHTIDDINLEVESRRSVPHSIWLAGECYENPNDPKY